VRYACTSSVRSHVFASTTAVTSRGLKIHHTIAAMAASTPRPIHGERRFGGMAAAARGAVRRSSPSRGISSIS
jgi:hypothetical protein